MKSTAHNGTGLIFSFKCIKHHIPTSLLELGDLIDDATSLLPCGFASSSSSIPVSVCLADSGLRMQQGAKQRVPLLLWGPQFPGREAQGDSLGPCNEDEVCGRGLVLAPVFLCQGS